MANKVKVIRLFEKVSESQKNRLRINNFSFAKPDI